MGTEHFIDEYRSNTEQSRRLHERAAQVIPGGDTRNITHHEPYPSFVSGGEGCRLTTVSDSVLIDFLNNYTVNIHGHGFEPVVEAICERYRRGNSPGAPVEEFITLAECLVERTPSFEKVRFCNSGTEATMHAIRGAMAHTGNTKILKAQGGYHGSHDTVEIGVHSEGRENPGIPKQVERRVETVGYNDVAALQDTFEEVGDELACFIVEPVLGAGGVIPATDEYLNTARDLTEATNTVLIFDEVISYRLAEGGAQELYDIVPDMTTLGKIIGGGLPVGAFGGRSDLMSIFHPVSGLVSQSGTFSGNPATMAGGLAALEEYDSETIEKLHQHGHSLRNALRDVATGVSIPIQITGIGSLFHIHFTEESVTDADSSTNGCEMARELFLAMRNRGIYISPRGIGCLSTPMSNDEIEAFETAFQESVGEIES
jgi:glutamate-1-semialdehyde 2,1-aminomutase